MSKEQFLSRQADELLAKAKCRWDGRKLGTAKSYEDVMRRAIRCPFGGYSRRKR